jgi:hypothetical protein
VAGNSLPWIIGCTCRLPFIRWSECVVRVVVIRPYLTPNFGWVHLEPLHGNVDPRRLAWTSQKMADSNHITSNPPAQTANPQRELPGCTLGVVNPVSLP